MFNVTWQKSFRKRKKNREIRLLMKNECDARAPECKVQTLFGVQNKSKKKERERYVQVCSNGNSITNSDNHRFVSACWWKKWVYDFVYLYIALKTHDYLNLNDRNGKWIETTQFKRFHTPPLAMIWVYVFIVITEITPGNTQKYEKSIYWLVSWKTLTSQ